MAGRFQIVVRAQRQGVPSNPSVFVFGYKSNIAVVNEESALSAAFQAQMVPELVKVMHQFQAIDRVQVYNRDNGVGYFDFNYVVPVVGLRTTDPVPDFTTYGFQYNRVNAGDRNGFKRIGIPGEGDLTGNIPSAAMLTILNALATKLGTPLTAGAIQTWFPVVLSRPNIHHATWTDYPILNVVFKRITSQNSRKL